jgi:hypothetical protein
MNRFRLVAGLVVCLGFCFGAQAVPIIISPSAFGSGTNISNAYPRVTLSEAAASLDTAGPIITVPLHLISNASGPVFSNGALFAHGGGVIWSSGPCCGIHNALRVDFADLVDLVAVQFFPDDNDGGVLQAYDSSGSLLAEQTRIANSPFTLEVSSAGLPISFILASYGDTGSIGTMSYEVRSVPSPTTLVLMVPGFAGLGLSMRRRKLSKH